MPIKRIQFPDGSIKRVEVPEGATDEQILSFVQSQHSPEQQKPDFSNVTASSKSSDKGYARRSNYNPTGIDALNPVTRQVGGFADAVQHHVLNIPVALGQGVTHGLNFATQKIAPGSEAAKRSQAHTNQQDAEVRDREAAYQARTADTAGSYVGAAVGEIAPWLVGIGELRAAGLLPTIAGVGAKAAAKKVGLLTAEGAAMGAAQPVIGEGDYGAQKATQIGVGALAAPAIAGGSKGVGAGIRGVRNLSRYATASGRETIANSRLAKLYGADPATLVQLRAGTNVPGFNLTPAQALATPEAVQTERVLRNNGLTAPNFAAQESANNAALRSEVARIAGTDADMAAAMDARRNGPGAFWQNNLARGAEDGRYGRAQKHLADILAKGGRMSGAERDMLDHARKIAGAVQRGVMDMAEGDAALRGLQPSTRIGQKAIEQALGVIDGGMVNPNRVVQQLEMLAKDTNPTISGAAEKALGSISKNQDGTGWVHARVLDGLRQNIGKLLADSAPIRGAGSAEGAAYGPVKAKIVNTIDRAIPGYRNSLASYASASQPINDMQAGRALLDAIDSGGRDAGGNQAVNLAPVRSLLAKDSRANFPMSQAAQQRIGSVLDALQRRSVTNNTVAAAGPGTAADAMRGAVDSPAGQWAQGGLAALLGSAAGGMDGGLLALLATGAAKNANNKVMQRVGTKAADAKLTADAIEEYLRMQGPGSSALPFYRYVTPLLPYTSTP